MLLRKQSEEKDSLDGGELLQIRNCRLQCEGDSGEVAQSWLSGIGWEGSLT